VQTFGREVAVKTIVQVSSVTVIAVAVAVWTALPRIAAHYNLSNREAAAWSTVAVLGALTLGLSSYLLVSKRRGKRASLPRKPASATLTLNGGVKPSVTLRNHGGATSYRVDGQIVEHLDGTPNPQPAPFRCELQVGGIKGAWDALLDDGEWANIVLGSLEDVFPKSQAGLTSTQSWTPVGKTMVIRRGKMGQHVHVPDSGVVVEITVRATPPLAEPIGPRRLRIVRAGNAATITYV
jgi:hypothetical protein